MTPFIHCLYDRVMVFLIFQFQNSCDFIFWPKCFFLFLFHVSHNHLIEYLPSESQPQKKKKKKYRTHRNPLFMFLIHCGISCHSDGCPHTHFIIRGSHQVFFPPYLFQTATNNTVIKQTINISLQPLLAVFNQIAFASNFRYNQSRSRSKANFMKSLVLVCFQSCLLLSPVHNEYKDLGVGSTKANEN